MAEWFVKDGESVTGPFTVQQMKSQASANRIKPETHVRKGHKGKWFAAKNVQGLLPTSAANRAGKSAAASNTKKQPTVAENVKEPMPQVTGSPPPDDEGTFLAPLHNRKRRAIVLGCIMAFILLGQAPFHKQLTFDLTVALIIGSFPIIEVKKKTIEQTIFVLFYPAHKKTWRLRDFISVEADVEQRASDQFGSAVYLIFWYTLIWRFFDFLMPWIGGSYKLYLKELTDERMLIWQGGNASDFEANLALFESKGLPIS